MVVKFYKKNFNSEKNHTFCNNSILRRSKVIIILEKVKSSLFGMNAL